MKKLIALVSVALLSGVTLPITANAEELPCSQGGFCKVGDTGPGGGIVFYVSDEVKSWGRYIEVSLNGWNRGRPDPSVQGYCPEKPDPFDPKPVTAQAIGAGKVNTDKLVKACPSGPAAVARSYRGGGFEDWSLPSKEEFAEFFYEAPGITLNSPRPWYWTSTNDEYGRSLAFYAPFEKFDGTYGSTNNAHIRPVRHFMSQADLLTQRRAPLEVSQKTLSAFSGSTTTLTTQQRAQVKAAVDANPSAEKFICTGIRFESAPMSENIVVRKRAKAACDYAKTLNPALSTFFQNKPTKARSFAGKVLLTVKSPTN